MTDRSAIWWHELNCRDAEAAKIFYARTLGWRFETLQLPNGEVYHVAWREGEPVCGLYALDPQAHAGIPAHWMTYLAVDDLDACLKETARAGGRMLRAPATLPGVGRLVVIEDATEAIIGLIEPAANHPLRRGKGKTALPHGHALQG